jgi:hypothetical protein
MTDGCPVVPPQQRAQIADCLTTERFQDGDLVLKEGEELTSDSKFYIIDAGSIECYKNFGVRAAACLPACSILSAQDCLLLPSVLLACPS